MEKDQKVAHGGSLHADHVVDATPHEIKTAEGAAKPQLSGGSFSTYYTYRGSGSVKLNCGNAGINSNSRVFAALSEYNTEPTVNRFIGNASMSILNVSPYNGGVVIWLSINWSSPINIRVDILVDP